MASSQESDRHERAVSEDSAAETRSARKCKNAELEGPLPAKA